MPQPSRAIAFKGAPGSPYTRKMLAVMRYRRIPYRFLQGMVDNADAGADLPKARVALLPTFYFQGDSGEMEAMVDSTPIIRRLEGLAPGRSVVPADPALAFVDALLEDYGDEWLTKAMFHYRWSFAADIEKGGEILPRWRDLTGAEADIAARSAFVRDRQIGRLHVVGSNEDTAPIIEASYRRFLQLFDAHIRHGPFLWGRRPSAGDFALFGQLTQLVAFDPTPMGIALRIAPQVCAWVGVAEDLSGLEPRPEDWVARDALPPTLRALLVEAGRAYAPAMLANAAAINAGADEARAQVDGGEWRQRPFPYQAKCLQALRVGYARLADEDRAAVDALLGDTGCEALFKAA